VLAFLKTLTVTYLLFDRRLATRFGCVSLQKPEINQDTKFRCDKQANSL